MPFDVEIKIIKTAPSDQLVRLYQDAGWWKTSWGQNPEFLTGIVKDSALFAGAFSGGNLVGMGRALSDLSSDAYIQDIAVLKKFRKKGIGKKIIFALVKELKKNGVDWIGIVAEPGTSSFYEKLGFKVLCNHVPMIYNSQ